MRSLAGCRISPSGPSEIASRKGGVPAFEGLSVSGATCARHHVCRGCQRRRGNQVSTCLFESSSVGPDVNSANDARPSLRNLRSIRTLNYSSVACRVFAAFSPAGALTALRARLLIDHTLPSLSSSRSRFSPSTGAGCGHFTPGVSFLTTSARLAGHWAANKREISATGCGAVMIAGPTSPIERHNYGKP